MYSNWWLNTERQDKRCTVLITQCQCHITQVWTRTTPITPSARVDKRGFSIALSSPSQKFNSKLEIAQRWQSTLCQYVLLLQGVVFDNFPKTDGVSPPGGYIFWFLAFPNFMPPDFHANLYVFDKYWGSLLFLLSYPELKNALKESTCRR